MNPSIWHIPMASEWPAIDLSGLIPTTRMTSLMTAHDDPPVDYVQISRRLFDHVQAHGFFFWRASPHPDAALIGARYRPGWTEVVRLNGWRSKCQAWKQPRRLVLAVPPPEAFEYLDGSALNVLNRVVCW